MARKITDEMRRADKKTIYTRFITPGERQRRIMEAGAAIGLNSIQKIADANGVTWTQMKNVMVRDDVSVRSLMRVAYTLGVTMSYLTER